MLKRLKAGTVRVYDEEYKCEYVGKYISEEKFIPVVIDELPKELDKQYERNTH